MSALALALKAPDALANPQFWAEDGSVFFLQQRDSAAPRLFVPYAGYLLVIPRIVAWCAAWFPAVYAPTIYCYSAWIIGAFALASLRGLRLGDLPFAVILSGIALTPTNGEVFGAIANVQWLLQFYVIVRVVSFVRGERCDAPWQRVPLALLVGLTGPFGIFGSVAAIGGLLCSRLLGRSDNASAPRWNLESAAFLLAACVQLTLILGGGNADPAPSPFDAKSTLRVLSLIQLHAFTVELLPRWLFRVSMLAVGAFAVLSLTDRRARLSALAVWAFAAVEMVAIVRKFSGEVSMALASFQNGDRYFVAIKAILFWQLALIIYWCFARVPRLRALVVAACLAASVFAYGDMLQRPAFPDLKWKEHAARIDAGEAAVIPILPVSWTVEVQARPTRARSAH